MFDIIIESKKDAAVRVIGFSSSTRDADSLVRDYKMELGATWDVWFEPSEQPQEKFVQ